MHTDTLISSIGTSLPSKLGIIVTSILAPLCILALCTIVGFAGICILLKLYLIRKQRKERSTANEVNQPCYEVIDPIYEAIPSTAAESTPDYFGIATMSNDAYTLMLRRLNAVTVHQWISMLQAMERMKKYYHQCNSSHQVASPWQFMATVTESEGPTKKHQCCDKQSIENIQQTELLCGSVKCASPKHVFN